MADNPPVYLSPQAHAEIERIYALNFENLSSLEEWKGYFKRLSAIVPPINIV